MKTRLTTKAAAMLAACLGIFVSCDETKQEIVNPEFPTFEDASVAPGESVTLEIEPNMAWSLSVPSDQLDWFWIAGEGEEKLQTVKGKEGAATIEIASSDAKDFELRTCEVTMTMGGESRKIMTITKEALEKTISVYAAKTDEWGFATDDSGNIVYDENPATDLSMYFDNTSFVCEQIVKVTANFNFALNDYPEWVVPNTNGNYGTSATVGDDGFARLEINLRGNASKLPLEDSEGKLVFVDTDVEETVKEISLTINGVKDYVDVEAFEAEFDAVGDLKSPMGDGYMPVPKTVSVKAPKDSKVYAVSYGGQGYMTVGASDGWTPSDESQAWLTLAMTDDSEATDVLHTYSLAIRPSANEGEAREAQIIVLPEHIASKITDPDNQLFDSSKENIKDEYVSWIKGTVSQLGQQGGGDDAITLLDGQAATLTRPDKSESWIYDFPGCSDFYVLTVNSNVNITLNFTQTDYFWDFQHLDEAKEIIEKPNEHWFCFDPSAAQQLSFWFETAPEFANEGYLVFLGENAVQLSVIKVIYDPEAEISGGALFSFVYPDYVQGATLEKLTEGSVFEQWNSETGANGEVYLLTYTTGSPMMAMVNIPARDSNMNWNDDAWLTYEQMDETSILVYMSDAGIGQYGAYVFRNNDWTGICVLVCTRTE